MNERIKELADQAGAIAIAENELTGDIYWRNEIALKKFAELIIQECASAGYDASYTECARHVYTKIKEHFRVKQ